MNRFKLAYFAKKLLQFRSFLCPVSFVNNCMRILTCRAKGLINSLSTGVMFSFGQHIVLLKLNTVEHTGKKRVLNKEVQSKERCGNQ